MIPENYLGTVAEVFGDDDAFNYICSARGDATDEEWLEMFGFYTPYPKQYAYGFYGIVYEPGGIKLYHTITVNVQKPWGYLGTDIEVYGCDKHDDIVFSFLDKKITWQTYGSYQQIIRQMQESFKTNPIPHMDYFSSDETIMTNVLNDGNVLFNDYVSRTAHIYGKLPHIVARVKL